MIIKKIRYGKEYDYDDRLKRFYNPRTNKWVLKIRPSTKGKHVGEGVGKSISRIENSGHFYYDFQLNQLGYSSEILERINFFLSKVERKYQQINWINKNDDNHKNGEESIVYFSTTEINYLLTNKNRNEIIQDLVVNDLVELKKKKKKSHFINGRFVTFINPKILWYFSPTRNLLSREKKLKEITFLRVNNSVNSYYQTIEKKLGDYADYYRKQYNCKFNITRDEFDLVIKSKFYRKSLNCSLDEYLTSSNYLYESILEWNRGTKYSNLTTYKIDLFSRRVHSIFSMLSSDFFRYNDTFKVEIDLVNCQPVMLAHILKSEIGENQFSTDIDNGIDVYEKIKDHYSLPDRDAGKKKFYQLVFGYNSSLEELYPEANQWIMTKKKFDLNEYRYKKDSPENRLMNYYNKKGQYIKRYSIIALMLQEKELEIFKRLWATLNSLDIVFVTRHDSVVINETDLDSAIVHINNILDDELCVNSRLRVKKY